MGSMVVLTDGVWESKKKTSGLSSGIIFAKATTKATNTTIDVASTNVKILDIKTGGSIIFATWTPTTYKMIVDNFI
jgi:hypothetical protein